MGYNNLNFVQKYTVIEKRTENRSYKTIIREDLITARSVTRKLLYNCNKIPDKGEKDNTFRENNH